MSDETTDESNAKGKETPDDTPKDKIVNNEHSPLEEADRINKEKASLLEREEKLQDRKEKMLAEEKVGGRANIGTIEDKKEETPKEYVDKVMAGEVGNEKA